MLALVFASAYNFNAGVELGRSGADPIIGKASEIMKRAPNFANVARCIAGADPRC